MRHIRNFFHNINDVVLAIIIVVIAVGIIYWRMQIILDYPRQLAEQQSVQSEEQIDTDADDASGEDVEDSADSGAEGADTNEASEGRE